MSLALVALLACASPGVAGQATRSGEVLLEEYACVACHEPAADTRREWRPKLAPNLERVASRIAPEYLRRFLRDPHSVKPDTTMPDLLATLPDEERAGALDALVHYLSGRGEPLDNTAERVGDPSVVEPGRVLFHEVGCVACHEPQETAAQLEVPWIEVREWIWEREEFDEDLWIPEGVLDPPNLRLGDLASKTTVAELTDFLLDPCASRPSGRMPAMNLTPLEARQIALYLLRDQAYAPGTTPSKLAGLRYEYFEVGGHGPAANLEGLGPSRAGVITDLSALPFRGSAPFAFRYRGELEVERPGTYTFVTGSDDGSRLWIDGELIVNNDGDHGHQERSGTLELQAGQHELLVTYYDVGWDSSLEVMWEGPEIEREVISAELLTHQSYAYELPTEFAFDPAKASEGEKWFADLGCVVCHEAAGQRSRALKFIDFKGLDSTSETGCLSERPAGRAPRFSFKEGERAALVDVLSSRDSLAEKRTHAEELAQTLERFRCLACHARDGVGGPNPLIKDWFVVHDEVDLGDQGRIPPVLTQVGRKLRREWMEATLFEGASVRPYMATRMPQFGREHIGHVVDLFRELDGAPKESEQSSFDPVRIEAGRTLVGTSGFGCVQCHTFNGMDALGVPAVDLAGVAEHVTAEWFRDLLLDPQSIDMNSRMPDFWENGKSPFQDVLGGDPVAQIDAIWSYLSLGTTMPVPDGLNPAAIDYEVAVTDAPRLTGVFMEGLSPRTVLVGTPEHVHYAFDVQNSRLAKVWRGRFFNAAGTWRGRAGSLETPPTDDLLEFPEGPSLARLKTFDAPWPSESSDCRTLGRRYDAERNPIFRYQVGEFEVEERVEPFVRNGRVWVARHFEVSGPLRLHQLNRDSTRLTLRVAVGDRITPVNELHASGEAPFNFPPGPNRFTAGNEQYRILLGQGSQSEATVVQVEGRDELRVDISYPKYYVSVFPPDPTRHEFVVEATW